MNKYLAVYNGKEVVIEASALYPAKLEAVKKLKVPKSKQHMVSVMLVEKDGEEIIHRADF